MDNKLTKIKERILFFAKNQGIAYEVFFETIGMTYGNFKGDNKNRPINSDALENILSIYKNLNPEWLLTGKGEMLLSDLNIQKSKKKIIKKGNLSFEELPTEEKLNVLYELCKDNFSNKNESKGDYIENESIKKLNRAVHGLASKDAHQDKYINFMRDKIIELEKSVEDKNKSLEDQKKIISQILEIIKDLKLTPH